MTKEKEAGCFVKYMSRAGSVIPIIVVVFAFSVLWGGAAEAYLTFGVNPNFEAPAKADAFLDDNDEAGLGDRQQSRGSILEAADLDNERRGTPESDDALNFFVTEYRINEHDQWEGFLRRYEATKNRATGQLETFFKWELGDDWGNYRGRRNLTYWNGDSFAAAAFTGTTNRDLARTRHTIASANPNTNTLNFTSVSASDVHNTNNQTHAEVINFIIDPRNVGPFNTYHNMMHPSRAFVDWYHGYDVSYQSLPENNTLPAMHIQRERGFLADPGNSGLLMVGPLQEPADEPLPGYNIFAASRRDINPRLFFQTNDGLLHVVDAVTGAEDMAILPPPMLLPHRAWSLKTFRTPVQNPAPDMYVFPPDSFATIWWSQGNNWNPHFSGTWNLSGMTLKDAIRHLNTASPNPSVRPGESGRRPQGQADNISFAIVPLGDNKARVEFRTGPGSSGGYILQGPAVEIMGIPAGDLTDSGSNGLTPEGQVLGMNGIFEGYSELSFPLENDFYRWIDPNVVDENAGAQINSRPMFTLDGPLQLRYFDLGSAVRHNWRAFMLATLGRGGGGLYAMDVTDPAGPEFLWYIETLEGVDNDPGSARVFHQTGADIQPTPIDVDLARHWNSIAAGNVYHAPYELYAQLGFNIPTPGFGVAGMSQGFATAYENIIAVPGGMQNIIDLENNGKTGAALYLINPADPGLPRIYTSASYINVANHWKVGGDVYGAEPWMGMMISEPLFLSLDSEDGYVSDGILAADNRGNIHHVSLTGFWDIKTVASLRTGFEGATDSYSAPHGLAAGTDRLGTVWIGGGTSNAGGWKNPMNIIFNNGDEPDIIIENREQMLFCFEFPDLENGRVSVRRESASKKWTNLAFEYSRDEFDDGWYLPLAEADGYFEAEYATLKPFMFGGEMFAATFQQRRYADDDGGFGGVSRLYVLDIATGEASRWIDAERNALKRFLEFDGIKITGFTHSRIGDTATLVISYLGLAGEGQDSIDRNTDEQRHNEKGSLSRVWGDRSNNDMQLALIPPADDTGAVTAPAVIIQGAPLTENDAVLNYWRFVELD